MMMHTHTWARWAGVFTLCSDCGLLAGPCPFCEHSGQEATCPMCEGTERYPLAPVPPQALAGMFPRWQEEDPATVAAWQRNLSVDVSQAVAKILGIGWPTLMDRISYGMADATSPRLASWRLNSSHHTATWPLVAERLRDLATA